MSGLASFGNQDFWPAFWRATLIKLDVLAIFMSISLVTYFFVAWATTAPTVPVAALTEVKTEYAAAMQARQPGARQPGARQPQVARSLAPKAKAAPPRVQPQARVQQRQAASVAKRAALADSRRVSEKSRRN